MRLRRPDGHALGLEGIEMTEPFTVDAMRERELVPYPDVMAPGSDEEGEG